MNKYLSFTLKLVFLVVIVFQIYQKVDLENIINALSKIDIINLVFAFVFFNLSYILSAIRFKGYINNNQKNINFKDSLNICYRSSMVSNFLPGGIGGEGYKLYTLNKIYNFSMVDAFKLVLSDRGSGMLALAILSLCLIIICDIKYAIISSNIILISLISILINLGLYRFITKKYLGETIKLSSFAFLYSVLVQLLCGLAYIIILLDMNNSIAIPDYVFAFFISSVALVLPISVGGIGIREISMVYIAYLVNINSELAIAGTIVFYLISLISSMTIGGLFFTKKILKS